MTYLLYGATLTFTWGVLVNVILSLAVALVAEPVCDAARSLRPAVAARLLLAVRLLPTAASALFVAAVFVPSYLRFEPRDFDEAFGLTTTSLALVASLSIAGAVRRGLGALRDARRRTEAWLSEAVPIDLGLTTMPTFCTPGPQPAMTLTGILAPTLIVTRPLLALLTRDELAAAVAHEHGHRGSRDNLKRLTLRSAPDALGWFAGARRLEHEWSRAAEFAADARAARDPGAGLALAAALLKVARFTPDRPVALSSPLVGGESLSSRVQRLVAPTPTVRVRRARVAAGSLLIAIAWAGLAAYQPLLRSVHGVTEAAVHRLP